MGSFRDREEFRRVFDRLFGILSQDPEAGPKLRASIILPVQKRWVARLPSDGLSHLLA